MNSQQHVRRASKSNFASLALDATAPLREPMRNETDLTGTSRRIGLRNKHPEEEHTVASMMLFDTLALDAAATPRQQRPNKQKLMGTHQRGILHKEQDEHSLASMVLFDALALDSACCPQRRRRQRQRAARQAAKFTVAQQVRRHAKSSEAEITLKHVINSFLPPSDRTHGFDQGPGNCGSSDSTEDHHASHVHTGSDFSSFSSAEADSSHDLCIEADL